jgi:hypothetical protein
METLVPKIRWKGDIKTLKEIINIKESLHKFSINKYGLYLMEKDRKRLRIILLKVFFRKGKELRVSLCGHNEIFNVNMKDSLTKTNNLLEVVVHNIFRDTQRADRYL